MIKINKIVLLIAVLLVFFIILGGTKLFQPFQETKKEYNFLSLFTEVISLVKLEYVEKIEPENKFPGAFSGMLNSLDNFSAYLDTQKTKIYRLYRRNKVCGSGIYGEKRFNYFFITDIEPGSPAEARGIKPGDTIKSINGENIYGKSFWEMSLALLTENPSSINIILFKEGKGDKTPQKITVDTLPIDSVCLFKQINDNIYLITLPRIDSQNAALTKRFLENTSGSNSELNLIIDLRKSCGGDLDSFMQIARLFFTSPAPLVLKTKQEEHQLEVGATHTFNYKAVVIIDSSTRLYSELLAVLFREYCKDNVTIIGSKTRGFIADLKQFSLDDGSSILLTHGLFLLKEKELAKRSFIPDIKINRKKAKNIIKTAADILQKSHD